MTRPSVLIVQNNFSGSINEIQKWLEEKGFDCHVSDNGAHAGWQGDRYSGNGHAGEPYKATDGDRQLSTDADRQETEDRANAAELFLFAEQDGRIQRGPDSAQFCPLSTEALDGNGERSPNNRAGSKARPRARDRVRPSKQRERPSESASDTRGVELEAIASSVASDVTAEFAIESALSQDQRLGTMIGASKAVRKLFRALRRVAATEASVLLIGESGTGKELAAEAVHEYSRRCDNNMVTVNCGAFSPELLESELFGHEKGAFTGATRAHTGYFERASGGTLFLDEITEMTPELQVKLLRVLEVGRFHRVGAEKELTVDVRIVAATNRNPAEAIASGRLRKDLFFRLNQFPVHVPPLRDRHGDVEVLAYHYLAQANQKFEEKKSLSIAALDKLKGYHWPGNVRELKNAVERGHIMADRVITDRDFELGMLETAIAESEEQQRPGPGNDENSSDYITVQVGSSIEEVQKALILATLEKYNQDKQRTASELGVSVKTLYNRLNEYGRK